jgi:ribonuclease HII
MKRGVNKLKNDTFPPDFLLVDGKFPISMRISQQALIKGEGRSASIAAASIIAKVTRDRIMEKLHDQYPQYNFKQNKGYPTKEHRDAVKNYGICPHHRLSFKGVKEFV